MEVKKRLFWGKLLLPYIKWLLRCCEQFLFSESDIFDCCLFLLIVYSHVLQLHCFTGSWKKQKREIKAFTMEELWWFKWILLVIVIFSLNEYFWCLRAWCFVGFSWLDWCWVGWVFLLFALVRCFFLYTAWVLRGALRFL